MEISDIIRKTITNTALNSAEKSQQDKLLTELREYGVMPKNAYTIRRKTILPINQKLGNVSFKTETNDILSNCVHYTDVTSNIKIPYINSDYVCWGSTHKEGNVNTSNVELNAKVINTFIELPVSYNIETKSFNNQIVEVLNNAIINKVVRTMFSTEEGDEEKPNGLLLNKATKEVSEDNIKDTIKDFFKNTNLLQGQWLMSPIVYSYLYYNFTKYFDNGKFFGYDYMVDNRVKDDYLLLIDLSKIVISDWNVYSVTIDNITQKFRGYYRIYVDTFVDFALMDDGAIKCLTIPFEEEEVEEQEETSNE